MKSIEERFWEKVVKTKSCWLWQSALSEKGYGLFWLKGKSVQAHRLSYEIANGKIPKGLQLDHLCRVHECVNPLHLRAVDNRTNVLAGIGPTALNHRKTHCPAGHKYSRKNTLKVATGWRQCKTCNAKRSRLWRIRKREESK